MDLCLLKGTVLILLDRAYCFKSGSYRQLAFFMYETGLVVIVEPRPQVKAQTRNVNGQFGLQS